MYKVLQLIFFFFTLLIGIRLTLLNNFVRVKSNSMAPTLKSGQLLKIHRFRDTSPEDIHLNDIILFEDPSGSKKNLVKRCVAVPGDSIIVLNKSHILVNDKLIPMGRSRKALVFYMKSSVVSYDRYFMVGDNYNDSFDSRDFGTVPVANIIGKVISL